MKLRKKPTCSVCGATGHTSRSKACPGPGATPSVPRCNDCESPLPCSAHAPEEASGRPDAGPKNDCEATSDPSGLLRVELDAAPLLVVEDLDAPGMNPRGAYVKLRPALRASAALSVDLGEVRAGFLERGALGVVVAPRRLADSRTEAEEERPLPTVDPREVLRSWVARQDGDGIDDELRAVVLEEAERFLSEEGV